MWWVNRWCKARCMTAVVQSLLLKGKERRPCRLALLSAALGPHGKSGKLCQAYLPSAARRIPLLRKMLFREVEVRLIRKKFPSLPLSHKNFPDSASRHRHCAVVFTEGERIFPSLGCVTPFRASCVFVRLYLAFILGCVTPAYFSHRHSGKLYLAFILGCVTPGASS